eukprot:1187866-Prorocentrum_minimum.AAC.2
MNTSPPLRNPPFFDRFGFYHRPGSSGGVSPPVSGGGPANAPRGPCVRRAVLPPQRPGEGIAPPQLRVLRVGQVLRSSVDARHIR